MYLLSVILPIFFIWLEYKKKIDFAEVFYIIVAKITILIGKEEIAKKYLQQLAEKYPNSIQGHKYLADNL